MASSPKLLYFFFLLALFFMQVYARDSQFFSKVSATTNPYTTTTVNGNKEEENLNQHEQEPTFMPETENGYGLYGHGQGQESTQFPTTTKLAGNAPYTTSTTTYTPYTTSTTTNTPYTTPTTTYTPYTTPTTSYTPYTTQAQPRETYTNYLNTNTYFDRQYNQYSNNANDQAQQQNFGETGLQGRSYTTRPGQTNNNKYSYNGANGYNTKGKQGMSDTRYLEHGRYYHDINNEHPPHQFQNSRINNYDSRGTYYDNKNNENTYEYSNSMDSNQNQEEFQEIEDEQYQP